MRGHIFGKDGLYAASLLVEMLAVTGKPLSQTVQEIFDEFGEMHMAEYDWLLTEPRKQEISSRVFERREVPEFDAQVARVSWEDGCKVVFTDGSWIILRFSGTEPRVRVFAEAETMDRARELVGQMAAPLGLPF